MNALCSAAARSSIRWALGAVLGAGLALAGTTESRAAESIRLDMPAQSLSLTLKRVARAGSVELAFDRAVTDRLRAPELKGQFTVDQALATALAATGLGVQRTSDGAYVVKPAPSGASAPPVDPNDGAVSELLVLGRRNLNTGIRRTRNDIQPYDVALEELIHNAGDTDIEGFMRTAMPADAQASSFAQAPALNSASARSRIDLLGLGGGQTLVLVDGRRLPSIPDTIGNGAGFAQADVNGVPLAAVERIEVLTAAAGALYGPGATGGVVNIILKRDYQGAEVQLTQGATQHGGGVASRLDAAIGRTSSDGQGGVSVRIGLARNQGLEVGQRVFGVRALDVIGADFTAKRVSRRYVPVGADINVAALNEPLTLKPAYGGAALGSLYTHVSKSGFTAAEAVANAGELDLELAPDAYGEKQSLVTETLRRSLIVSARREIGLFDGFFDYLYLDNRGRATVPGGEAALGPISADSPYNPFEQTVYVSRSTPWDGVVRNRSFTQRANAGLIMRLPEGWTAEGDVSRSESMVRVVNQARGTSLDASLSLLIGGGVVGPDLSPFASDETFLAAYRAYQLAGGSFLKLRDTLDNVTLRASGPLWRLPGGPMTMTVSAEASRERTDGIGADYDDLTSEPRALQGNPLRLATRSAYAEWRAPLRSTDAPGPFRGLELQVALRADAYRMTTPQSLEGVGQPVVLSDVVSKHSVVASTVGLRTFVADGVMLRASYSEGHLPPRSDQVQSRIVYWNRPFGFNRDPRRAGQIIGTDQPLRFIAEGSPDLDPETARTFSLGLVVEPPGLTGARLSVDYLRTDKRREITDFASGDVDYFLDHEALYPDRVVRAPLTDADRARGFTGGAITLLDTSAMNVGRSVAETVDVSAEYRRDVAGGEAGAYLRAVWQPSYRRRADPEGAWTETAGYSDGPLRVRGFAGVQWSKDALGLGLNAQYYGSYRVAESGFAAPAVDPTPGIAPQEVGRIHPQVYFDVFSRWSFRPGDRAQVQVRVRNLLDATPPLAVAVPMGYSPYGDARGRAFEISLARRF